MRSVLLAIIVLMMLIWVATGGVHWGTAAVMSIWAVMLGSAVSVLGALKAQKKLNGAYWAEKLEIRRFHGFGALGWMLLVMMLMTMVSLVPLPLGLLEVLSPAAADWYREAWQIAGMDKEWGRLTAAGGRTAFALWMLVGFFGVYWGAVRLGGTRQRVTRISHVLSAMGGLFVAMMGLRFVGYPISLGETGAQSPWHIGLPVNVNHLSGVMLMLTLMALGGILTKRHRNTHARRALWGFLYLVFGVTVVMLKSRGAILALGLGHLMVIGLYFAVSRQIKWKTGLAMAGGLGLILAAVLVISAPTIGQIVEEYEATEIVFEASTDDLQAVDAPKSISKTQIYADLWPMARDWGRAGIGRSAFNDVYPQYQGFGFAKRFRHAENEWLETWLEYGWLGGLLCLVLGTIGIFKLVRMVGKQQQESKLTIGILAALLAVSIQNLFDFGLRYWTVGFLFWLFCGVLESRRQRWQYGKIEQDKAEISQRLQIEYGLGMGIWAAAIVTSLFTASLAVDGLTESGLKQLQNTPEFTICAQNMVVRPGSPEVRKIMGFDELKQSKNINPMPENKGNLAETGTETQQAASSPHQHWLAARHWLESAHAKAPRQGQISLHLAKTCLALGDLECATKHFQRAIQNTPRLRELAMYEIAGMPENWIQMPEDAVSRESLIRALKERQRFDVASQLISAWTNPQFDVEHAKLMCIVYESIGFIEGCHTLVENLGDLPVTGDLSVTLNYLNLKTQYMIRHEDWENLFKLYETTEKILQTQREYWRNRLYHSVFYGKHRSPEWYHNAVPSIFWRYRQISDGDKQWRFDDAYCGAFYAFEMDQISRAVRDAKAALSIKPHHKGAQNILKEAEKRQKNPFKLQGISQ